MTSIDDEVRRAVEAQIANRRKGDLEAAAHRKRVEADLNTCKNLFTRLQIEQRLQEINRVYLNQRGAIAVAHGFCIFSEDDHDLITKWSQAVSAGKLSWDSYEIDARVYRKDRHDPEYRFDSYVYEGSGYSKKIISQTSNMRALGYLVPLNRANVTKELAEHVATLFSAGIFQRS